MLLSEYMVMASVKFGVESRYSKLMWFEDWIKVPVVETMQRVVRVTTNRVFVGTPLCRLKLSDSFIQLICDNLSLFPKPLHPYIDLSSGCHKPLLLS
jgi:hypothetical protein